MLHAAVYGHSSDSKSSKRQLTATNANAITLTTQPMTVPPRIEDLPPTLKLSRLLQLKEWLTDPEKLIARGIKSSGKTFTLEVGSLGPTVITGEPQIVRQVFQNRVEIGDDNFVFEPVLGAQSIIVATGATHKQLRSKLLPFFQGKSLRQSLPRIKQLCDRAVGRILGRSFYARQEMELLTLDVMIEFLFGPVEMELHQRLIGAAKRFLEIFRHWTGLLGLFLPKVRFELLGFGPGAYISKSLRELNNTILEVISKTPAVQLSETIVGALVTEPHTLIHADSEEQGLILDQVKTLLFAGYETTSSSLAWMLHCLSRDTEIQEEIRAEMKAVNVIDDLLNMGDSCLNHSWNETLRCFPIATITFMRRLTAPLEWAQGSLPTGTVIAPSALISHFDESVWGEQVRTWKPNRFETIRPAPFEFYPFGGGSRRCIGAHLANIEMALFMHTLLRKASVSSCSNTAIHLRRKGITMLPCPDPVVSCSFI